MGAMLKNALVAEGLKLSLDGNGRLQVDSAQPMTETTRRLIRDHREELIAELAANDHEHAIEPQPTAEPKPVLCIACQHYRFGHDHAGNVARCHAAGGFRGALIERPEQRRECGGFVVYQGWRGCPEN